MTTDLEKINSNLALQVTKLQQELTCYKSKHDARYIRKIANTGILGPAQKRRLLAIADRLTPQGLTYAR